MKSTQFDEQDAAVPALAAKAVVGRLYPPASGSRAEILSGSEAKWPRGWRRSLRRKDW